MSKKTSLGVIVPCYNEVSNVDYFEKELTQFMNKVQSRASHYLVKFYIIENNSSDGTFEKLKTLANKYQNLVFIDQCNVQGYGAALKYGFNHYKNESDYLAFLDFDNTYPLESLIDLLNKVIYDKLDIVFGVRLHQASAISPIRSVGNLLYVKLLKFILKSNLSDVCTGMRIFKSDLADQITTLSRNDLSFSIQFTAYAIIKKWKIGEHPIFYRKRIGSSKLSVIVDGFKFLFILIKTTYVKNV